MLNAQRAEPEPTGRRRDRGRRAADRRDARSVGDHLLDRRQARPAIRVARERPKLPVVAITPESRNRAKTRRWCGACIAWSQETRRIRTTWSNRASSIALPGRLCPGGPARHHRRRRAARASPAPPTWLRIASVGLSGDAGCDRLPDTVMERRSRPRPALWPAWCRLHHETAARRRVHHADGARARAASRSARRRAALAGSSRLSGASGRTSALRMQRAEQRGCGKRGILRRQMTGAHRGIDAGCDLAGDLARGYASRDAGDVDDRPARPKCPRRACAATARGRQPW